MRPPRALTHRIQIGIEFAFLANYRHVAQWKSTTLTRWGSAVQSRPCLPARNLLSPGKRRSPAHEPPSMSEIQVRLPDGKALTVPAGSSVLSVAERIGKGLARAALAGRVDGRLVDLRFPLHGDVSIEIVTARDPAGGEVIRHSAEHVMADAVKRLFPSAQVDAGRSDHSEKFQYDFLVERPFTPEDLEQIEKEMTKIIAEKAPFTREVMSRSAAKAFFEAQGETLKVSRLADIPEGEEITVFRHGGFADLCRGPHVQRTDQIGAFTLLESAGSYWRGDERNPMLQRIYGTAFATRKELDEHRARLEEARRRDHRRVGRGSRALPPRPDRARLAVLSAQGRAALQRPGRLRALALPRLRLRGGDLAAGLPHGALQDLGPLPALPRGHVPDGGRRGRGARAQADELPRPLSPVREPQALLSRAAAAAGRVHAAAPQRARRHADRPLARALLRAGRCARLLRAGAGRRRAGQLLPR